MTPIPPKKSYLTQSEVMELVGAAKRSSRHSLRDIALVLNAWRHGLRASEVGLVRWENIDWRVAEVFIIRLKRSNSGAAPLWADEMKALKRLHNSVGSPSSGYVFLSERGYPIGRKGVYKLLQRLGQAAQLPFTPNPHQLRHGCGYHHINKGASVKLVQKLLGHKDIRHTDHYTQLAPGALRELLD